MAFALLILLASVQESAVEVWTGGDDGLTQRFADPRYRLPTRPERLALLIGFAMHGMTLNGAAFDAVRLDQPLDLLDADAIAASIDSLTICEIKSTNQKRIGPDLKGYFFNITAAEQLTAQRRSRLVST